MAQQRESEHSMVAARTPFGVLLKRYRVAADLLRALAHQALSDMTRRS